MKKHATALIVMSSVRRLAPLLSLLESMDLTVYTARSCCEARSLLNHASPVNLVITDLSHADGNWCDVFTFVVDHGIPASVIVTAPAANAVLWSEVLWRGVYDMLVEPYRSGEVRQVVDGALRAVSSSTREKPSRLAAAS